MARSRYFLFNSVLCRYVFSEYPDRALWLVIVKGFGSKSLMLLTTEPMRRNRKVIWWIVEAYITRWRVEETIRFIKQSYDIEDIRVLTYDRLKNMAVLVMAASFFAAVWLGTTTRMNIFAMHTMNAAKRLFGIPDFRYYAVVDCIKTIFRRIGKEPLHPRGHESPQHHSYLYGLHKMGEIQLVLNLTKTGLSFSTARLYTVCCLSVKRYY